MAPYQIVFGRERNLHGIPYPPDRTAETAVAFFALMEEVDSQVAKALEAEHTKVAEKWNVDRQVTPAYAVGDYAWLLRPPSIVGPKVSPHWEGPYKVVARLGQSTYRVQVRLGRVQDVHLDQMKPAVGEALKGPSIPLAYRKGVPRAPVVEAVVAHRTNAAGTVEFLTRWSGATAAEDSWEPTARFAAN